MLKTDKQLPDSDAWLDKHGDYLFRYAMIRLRDRSTAEDVLQETLLAALRSYDNFAGRSSERTWLVGILKHKLLDHFRRIGRESPIDTMAEESVAEFFETASSAGSWRADQAPTDWHTTPAELLERSNFWEVFNDCLADLPERTASAFTLREVEGLKSREICETLGISVNNLWVMLHRARLHLRHCLEMNWFRRAAES